MEYNSPFDSFELQVSAAARDYLRVAAKWAMFLSIIGFIFVGLAVLGGLMFMAMGSAFESAEEMPGMSGGMNPFAMFGGFTIGLIYFIIAIIYFFPVFYLYKFASKMKAALNANNNDELTSSFESLKSHYKFLGIFTLIFIILYILIIIFAIVGGVAAASGAM